MTSDIKLENENVILEGVLCVQEIAGWNNQVKITGYDVLLDHAERRKAGSDPNQPRRALVHDDGDRLAINYGGDYPGGVSIQGPVAIQGGLAVQGPLAIEGSLAIQANLEIGEITGKNRQLKIKGYDLLLDEASRREYGSDPALPRRALVHDVGDRLTINYGGDYPGGVTMVGSVEFTGPVAIQSIFGAVEIGEIKGKNRQLKIKGYDLLLDETSRRKPGSDSKHPRRALVHDVGDRLTINYGGDYPGGVTLVGPVALQGSVEIAEITGTNKQLKIKGYDLILDEASRRKAGSDPMVSRRALVHDVGDRLTINYGGDYPGGVTVAGPVALVGAVDMGEIVPSDGKLNVTGEIVVSKAKTIVLKTAIEKVLDIKNDTILAKTLKKTGAIWSEVDVLDLVQGIRDLQVKVKTLEDEITKLKSPK